MSFEDTFRSIRVKDTLKVTTISGTTLEGTTVIANGALRLAIETKTGTGALSPTVPISEIITQGGVSQAFTLADGSSGAIKIVKCVTYSGTGVLTPASFKDGTTLTFTAVNQKAMLYFDGTKWSVLNTTAALA